MSMVFPVLAALAALLAVRWPALFMPLSGWTGWLLALVMFGMGATLQPADLRRVLRRPAPLLAWLYIARGIHLDSFGLLRSILVIVALPVRPGLVANHGRGAWKQALPVLSMLCVVLIIGVVVASSRGVLARLGPAVLIGVMLHDAVGLVGGYWGGRAPGFDVATCRTLAFEVGMQNSGLAATLARIYISPVAALPGAMFPVWHNLSGSTLASCWNRRGIDRKFLSID